MANKKHPHDKGITLGKLILKSYSAEELAGVLGGMRRHLSDELKKEDQSEQVRNALIQIGA